MHYDPDKALLSSCDASPYGIGAVLSDFTGDEEKPIAYASRTLSPAEQKYSQLDQETLAIVYGAKTINQYLNGKQFNILSEHKPLQYPLSADKAVPSMSTARFQRWALTLSAYKYVSRPGEKMANADMLSHLPLPEAGPEEPVPPETVLLLETLDSSPITAGHIKQWTDDNPYLSRVRNLVSKGWPGSVSDDLQPYYWQKDELSTECGCVLFGNRVVNPCVGREKLRNCSIKDILE